MKSLCPYSGLSVSDWISVTVSNFQIFSVQLMFDLGDVYPLMSLLFLLDFMLLGLVIVYIVIKSILIFSAL